MPDTILTDVPGRTGTEPCSSKNRAFANSLASCAFAFSSPAFPYSRTAAGARSDCAFRYIEDRLAAAAKARAQRRTRMGREWVWVIAVLLSLAAPADAEQQRQPEIIYIDEMAPPRTLRQMYADAALVARVTVEAIGSPRRQSGEMPVAI